MRRRSTSLPLLLGVAVALSSAPLAAVAAPDAPPVPPKLQALLDAQGERPAGEAVGLIVRYAPGVAPTQAGEVTGAARVAVELTPGENLGRGLRTVEFDETLTAEQALEAAAQLEASPLVVDVQPNYVYRVGEVVETTDAFEPPYSFTKTQTSTTWGLGRIDQVPSSLDYRYTYDTTGEGVTAYIVDTGIRPTHVEFTGRLAPGFKLPGFATTGDCNGHGTHVAGTVGGTTYGVAKKVTLVPVRVFGCDGSGDTVGLVQALNWIIADHQVGEPAVINMSLGGPYDVTLNNTVQDAINDGITVVVAAGNDSEPSCYYSPSSATNAITVNAATKNNIDASYSNFGSCSDIYAPGSEVKSADKDSNTDSKILSGTSMAAPHVAGVAARILSHWPELTPAQVAAKILGEASPFYTGLNDYFEAICAESPWIAPCANGVLLNDPEIILFAAQLQPLLETQNPTITGSPVGTSTLTATVGSWLQTAPEPDVDPPLTYQWKRSGTAIPGATGLEYTLTPADVGKTITFTVTGNVQGFSSLAKTSTPTAVVTRPPLGAPTGFNLTPLPGRIGVEWSPPAQTGGTIIDYVIQYRSISSTTYLTFNDGVGATYFDTEITGLSRGASYYVRVAAKDEYGLSTYTPAVLVKTLTGVTTAPTGLTATAAPRSIQLDWSAPSTLNGGTVTDYIVRYRVTGTTTWKTFTDGVSTSTTATVTGLSGSRSYEFAVQARTAFGTSSSATIKKSTLSGLPTRPATLTATASRTSMELVWGLPDTTNGGGDVTAYVVKVRRSGTTTWTTVATTASDASSITVPNLSRGISYEFSVAAKTTYGTGTAATLKKSTLTGLPSAVVGLTTTPTLTGMELAWSAPATTNDGGSVTDYVISYRRTGTTTWTTVTDGVSATTGFTFSTLKRATSYEFRVSAKTIYGTGTSTTVKRSTLTGVASAPTGLAASARTAKTISLSWTAPATTNGGTITDYVVRYRLAGTTTWLTFADGVSTGTTATITGLTRSKSYDVNVYARTLAGTTTLAGSSTTLRVMTLSGAPTAPVITEDERGASNLEVFVNATADPAYPITSYRVEYRLKTEANDQPWIVAPQSLTGPGDTMIITGLSQNTDYEVRATATSAGGTSPFSAIFTGRTAIAPF
ncbi:MAG: fibronectin type III domain-containing protein [Yonghaparkia sp.]|nr:fibronectin type III domain-containing protein [Microcella sp.]